MISDEPSPDAAIPKPIVDAFDELSPETLQHTARYAAQLEEHRVRERRLAEKSHDTKSTDRPDDLPTGVPSKASITVKEINDNRYHYWQWRDGDKIKSKYKGPVSADE